MKVKSVTFTSPSPTTMVSSSITEKSNQRVLVEETKRLARVNLVDFIRGDSRLPERYVFSPDLFSDYSRSTQRDLVAMIQHVCEAQNSPVSVHQWATEEHDDRIVRRIRFRCAFFRKKKRSGPSVPTCGFQFQVCYQAKYGWCMLNGKGHCRHSGHPVGKNAPKQTPRASKASPPKVSPELKLPAIKEESFTPDRASSPVTCVSCSSNEENVATADNMSMARAKSAAWKDLKESTTSDSKIDPMYVDFALDSDMFEDDIMNWDLLDEMDVPQPTSTPNCSNGLLEKTINLAEIPFPELADIEDKCVGILHALRAYASAHNFALTVEDFATVDRPGEKTMRVVLHCLGSNCSYQVALLWVVGLTRWTVYCQPDGIFVHSCGRYGDQASSCSAMAATPLNQAFDHLEDFLNGEVVCPDEETDPTTAALNWKEREEKPVVSEKVRKETHIAVSKVAGIDSTASAA